MSLAVKMFPGDYILVIPGEPVTSAAVGIKMYLLLDMLFFDGDAF